MIANDEIISESRLKKELRREKRLVFIIRVAQAAIIVALLSAIGFSLYIAQIAHAYGINII